MTSIHHKASDDSMQLVTSLEYVKTSVTSFLTTKVDSSLKSSETSERSVSDVKRALRKLVKAKVLIPYHELQESLRRMPSGDTKGKRDASPFVVKHVKEDNFQRLQTIREQALLRLYLLSHFGLMDYVQAFAATKVLHRRSKHANSCVASAKSSGVDAMLRDVTSILSLAAFCWPRAYLDELSPSVSDEQESNKGKDVIPLNMNAFVPETLSLLPVPHTVRPNVRKQILEFFEISKVKDDQSQGVLRRPKRKRGGLSTAAVANTSKTSDAAKSSSSLPKNGTIRQPLLSRQSSLSRVLPRHFHGHQSLTVVAALPSTLQVQNRKTQSSRRGSSSQTSVVQSRSKPQRRTSTSAMSSKAALCKHHSLSSRVSKSRIPKQAETPSKSRPSGGSTHLLIMVEETPPKAVVGAKCASHQPVFSTNSLRTRALWNGA